ncbi:MAG TPA: HEAT repeat domain-containing protein [Gemmatimonadaceae bacterium]|nr:HEAT repeat domain-containing protein [Gemmatimonadaceae bacterium]
MSATALPIDEGADRDEPPFAPALVEDMLRLLGKTARAHALYLHNNPTYLRTLEQLRASFAPIWAEASALVLTVGDTELRWEGRTVLAEADKSSEALPWLLYKDGIRELHLLPGFEREELEVFLDLVLAVRRVGNVEDDLITLLWERDLAFLRYRFVDVADDGVFAFERKQQAGPSSLVTASALQTAVQQQAGLVRIDDYQGTLHFLNAQEVEYLRREVEREYNRDLHAATVATLLDMYELQGDQPGARDEICAAVDTLLVQLLTTRAFRSVALLLREARATSARSTGADAVHQRRLAALPDRLSTPEAVAQLLEALDAAQEPPPQAEIDELFAELRPAALGSLFRALDAVQSPGVRGALRAAADRLASANTAELVRLLGDADRAVALEAARRAGALRAAAAVPALGAQLRGSDATLRQTAAQALADIGSAGALQQLEQLLVDVDRDVRVIAARAMGARGYRAALPRLEAVVRSKACRDADLTEKMAVFESYGALCGDAGVSFLDGILNARGLLGRREDPALRACAAVALGRIGSGAAIDALRRCADEKEVVVRNAVSKALRGGSA